MPRPTSPSVAAAVLDARCLDLRRAGLTYREIGRQLDISPAQAHKRVMRGLDLTRREPANALRELELERLDAVQVALTTVLRRRHVTVSGGKIITDDDDQPLLDDGPTIAAAQALVRVGESRRRLLGLDEPARADITAKVHADVYSVGALDRELERLTAELAEEDTGWGVAERRRQDLDRRLGRLRADWSSPGRVAADPARFVGDALDLALQLLDLDDQEREAAAVEVERLLWERAR